jgi:glycosyltransferase involved in cell wall biosynthesis
MRVVHVVTAFPRDPGDVITPWMVELVRRSRDRGLEAEVLAPAYRGSTDHALGEIPVRRFRYAPAPLETLTHDETTPDRLRRSPAHAALVPPYLAGGALAAWRLGRERPDVIHVHWPMPHALIGAAGRAGSGGATALVCSYYAVEVNWVTNRLPWLRPFLRWTARTADAVTAISTSTAASVRDVAGRDPVVIPFAAAVGDGGGAGGRDAAPGTNGGDGEAGRRTPLAGDGPLELLFVGRLVERKGVEVLVRALARVVRHREARLTVVGEGSWEPRIRDAVEKAGVGDRVRFTGHVPEDELSRRYRTCDIFVLPAVVDRKGDTEGLGVVLLEALRFERPVIASRVGGIPDIVEDGRTGWLVPPRDPDALAEAVLRVAARPGESRRVAREGRRIVARRFSWDRILDDLERCYRGARRRRRAAGASA